MDVIVTHLDATLMLARCKASLRNYLPPDCTVHIESETERRSWRDNVLAGLEKCKGPLVFIIQDDAQLMCLRPSWMQELAKPFEDDKFVAVSCMTSTQISYPHQSVRLGLPPGSYYTTQFIPVAFMARVDALKEAIQPGVFSDDRLGDHAPGLNLLMAGYKLVINTHLPSYHEGMQTNPRYYEMDEAVTFTREQIMKNYPPLWVERMEQTEMVPMQNYLAKTKDGMVTRI